jgi:hypothetical protein
MRELITAKSMLICDGLAAAYRHSETIVGGSNINLQRRGFLFMIETNKL